MTATTPLSPADLDWTRQALLAATLVRFAETATVAALRVPWPGLKNPSRGRRRESQARQVAIYLPHLIWGLDFMDLSRMTGRERTTVRHACRCVATARGRASFDRQLSILEQAIRRDVDETLGPICR